MTRSPHRLGAIALIVAAAALTAACAGGPSAAPTGEATSPVPVATSPSPTAASDETAVPAAQPTCDRIIPESTVEQFEKVGWTAKSEPMRIGELVIDAGVQCTWGDFTTATDRVQIFGWAPIETADATEAQQTLAAEGWKREEGAGGVYLTEPESTTIATDAEGYGLTYQFGAGWVKYADTKQSLLLIEWPKV
nr:hypothetical protein [Microbacterium lemovicicum]